MASPARTDVTDEEKRADFRARVLKKLGAAPYRFSSKVVADSIKEGWRDVEACLEEMLVSGEVHAQNGEFIRTDWMTRTPQVRRKPMKKIDPRQKGFGFE